MNKVHTSCLFAFKIIKLSSFCASKDENDLRLVKQPNENVCDDYNKRGFIIIIIIKIMTQITWQLSQHQGADCESQAVWP